MKKFFILQIVVVSFLVLSCKNFLSENSLFASKMAEEVSYATATEVFVTVSEPTEGSTKYGNMIKGSRDVKVGFPFEIEYELAKEEGYFCYWEAFENYSANKTNTPITDTEIIEFEDIYKNPTKVTLKKEVQNIRIIPKINKTPMINIESPDYGTSSLTGETKLLPGETIPVVISSFDQYGITNLKITSRDISKEIISSLDLRTIESFSESVLLKDSKDHILFTLTNLRVSSNLSTVSFILEAGSGLDAVYNLGADFAPRPQIDATSNVPSQSEGVMRTTPIKIKFTNEMDVSLITAENYKEFISISRVKENPETSEETIYDCFSDSEYNDKSYFSVPEFLSDKKTLLISPVNKLDKTEWLPSGSKLRVTISESLCDINSVPMLNKYSFAFTLGTEGDAEGPIITNEKTNLSIVSSEKEISQSEWGDFEPSKNADEDHIYADSIHVGPGESFKAVIQASDLSTGDTGIKEFVADIRLMYIYEGGRLPNSSEKALKNLILFDKDGNWLYESGFLKQDFYKEKSLTYSGTNKIADTESDFIFDFEDFITDETSGSLSVDGIYRIALTAKDALDNYSANPNVYYVVRDTTAPDAEKNAANISFTDDCGVEVNGKRYFGGNFKTITLYINGDVLDLGTQGQPQLATKKETNSLSIVLNASDSFVYNESTNISEWKQEKGLNKSLTFEIPSEMLNNSIDKNIYIWSQFSDGFDHISEKHLSPLALKIDNTKPTITVNSKENVYSSFCDNNEIKIFTEKKSSQKQSVEILFSDNSENSSGIKNLTLNRNGQSSELPLNTKEISLDLDVPYTLCISDNVGNKNEYNISVSSKYEGAFPSIEFLSFNDGHISKDPLLNKTYGIYDIDTNEYINCYFSPKDSLGRDFISGNTFYLSFIVNSSRYKLSENTLQFENFEADEIKVIAKKEKNEIGTIIYHQYETEHDWYPFADSFDITKNPNNGIIFKEYNEPGYFEITIRGKLKDDYLFDLKNKIEGNRLLPSYLQLPESELNSVYLECTVNNEKFSNNYKFGPFTLDVWAPEIIDYGSLSGIPYTIDKYGHREYEIKSGENGKPIITGIKTKDNITYLQNNIDPTVDMSNLCQSYIWPEGKSLINTEKFYLYIGFENTNRITFSDPLGNGTYITLKLLLDKTAPYIDASESFLDENDTYWYSGDKGLTLTIKDADSELLSSYILDENNQLSFLHENTITLHVPIDDNDHFFTVIAEDIYGNILNKKINIKQTNIRPSIEITGIVDQLTIWNPSVNEYTRNKTRGYNPSSDKEIIFDSFNTIYEGILKTTEVKSSQFPQAFSFSINNNYPLGYRGGKGNSITKDGQEITDTGASSVILKVSSGPLGIKENGIELFSKKGWQNINNFTDDDMKINLSEGTIFDNAQICFNTTEPVITLRITDRLNQSTYISENNLPEETTGPKFITSIDNNEVFIDSRINDKSSTLDFYYTNIRTAYSTPKVGLSLSHTESGYTDFYALDDTQVDTLEKLQISLKYPYRIYSNYKSYKIKTYSLLGTEMQTVVYIRQPTYYQIFSTSSIPSDERNTFINDSILPWEIDTTENHIGLGESSTNNFSLKSPSDFSNSNSEIKLEITGCHFAFWYKISSEQKYDYLEFLVNGNTIFTDSGYNEDGNEEWKYFSITFRGAGDSTEGIGTYSERRTFTWRYHKDGTVSKGKDAVWIDGIMSSF
ncbi:MAG: hypothetical protein MJ185_10785 [Treponema sp.]|nr:hypothetical protein [Treponema sp.]